MLKVGYIADLATPNQAMFFYLPDFNIPGLLRSLEEYTKYDVDKIVFSHSANPDILAPGTKEVHRFYIQYIKVNNRSEPSFILTVYFRIFKML